MLLTLCFAPAAAELTIYPHLETERRKSHVARRQLEPGAAIIKARLSILEVR